MIINALQWTRKSALMAEMMLWYVEGKELLKGNSSICKIMDKFQVGS